MPVLGLAKAVEHLVEGGVGVDASQSVQVAFGGLVRDLGAALEVGDASSQGTPGQSTLGVTLLATIDTAVADVLMVGSVRSTLPTLW